MELFTSLKRLPTGIQLLPDADGWTYLWDISPHGPTIMPFASIFLQG